MSVAEKFRNLALAIRQNGGLWKSIQTLYRIDELKDGILVGTDRNGNRYYQNKRFFVGKYLSHSLKIFAYILYNSLRN